MPPTERTRFDSWKDIASYLGRDVRTARRWETERGLPVHRVPGGERPAVFAYRHEIDSWLTRASGLDGDISPVGQQAGHGLGSESPTLPRQEAVRSGLRWLRVVELVGLGLVVLLVVAVLLGRKRVPAAAQVLEAPVIPQGIKHWLRIGLVNGQPQSVIGPFQQLLVVETSQYAPYEAHNLQNVQFFDDRGTLLPSWLESGNSNLSARTLYWVQLEGLPASRVVNIYMGFAPPAQNLFDASTTGEAPGLSPVYGQYDSGPSVFLKYANFAGQSLPQGWYSGSSPEGQRSVQVNNGVLITHSGRGAGTAFLGSDWNAEDNVAEMDLLSHVAINGQEMIFVCSANPTSYRWTPYSVGYQNMSGLEIEDNNSGTPSVLAIAKPNPTWSSVVGFQGGVLFANYQPVARVYPRICGGGYLASSVNTGTRASFSFDWVRLRRPPPNGVMPTVIFGELKSEGVVMRRP